MGSRSFPVDNINNNTLYFQEPLCHWQLRGGSGQVGGWEKRGKSKRTGMTYKHNASRVMPGPSGAFITLFGTGEHSKSTGKFSDFTTLAPHALASLWSHQKKTACLSKGPWTNCMLVKGHRTAVTLGTLTEETSHLSLSLTLQWIPLPAMQVSG